MPTRMEFDEFVRVRSHALLRLAFAFTRDHALAEDLLQTALARTWPVWKRIEGDPEPYVRRVLVNTFNSWWRRRWTGEHPTEVLPERATPAPQGGVDDRDEIGRALARLPRQQRSVLVLRYFADLPEAEIAQVMGVTPGAVKGYASKGLARLRLDPALLAQFAPEPAPTGIERVSAVRERVRQRKHNRLVAAGAAAAVALALTAALLAGGWLRRNTHPHPVEPTPSVSASVLRPSGIYFWGQRVLVEARDLPLDQGPHSLTFTPQPGKVYRLATACAYLAADPSRVTVQQRTTFSGETGYFGESCDGMTEPADLSVREWTRHRGTYDLTNLTPGVAKTLKVEVVPYPGNTMPKQGLFSMAITEEVAYADYPFPPRPATLEPLRHDDPQEGRRPVYAGGPTVITMPWTGGLALSGSSQTPGRLEVTVNGVRLPRLDVKFWTYEPSTAGRYQAIGWPKGIPGPQLGSIVTIEVRPIDLTGDWWAEIAGPDNDWASESKAYDYGPYPRPVRR